VTDPVLFAGPSIFGLDPGLFSGIDLKPPAACGDLLAAVLAGATAIGLVDGSFENVPSVWHKEILYALSLGVTVLGAASMGALRAAECARFGMVGVGEIFVEFASGSRTADADVAVVHAPRDLHYRPLTLALVDAEATIASIREAGALPAELCDTLVAAARALHFKDRTWPELIAQSGLPSGSAPAIETALSRCERSVKREDAMLLIEQLRKGSQPRPASITPGRLARTDFLTLLEQRVRAERLGYRP